jgi:NAD dependent epimerase/dehydratase family enzyme
MCQVDPRRTRRGRVQPRSVIVLALERSDVDGPVNLTAPEPVRACEFARTLGRVLGRRAWLPVPSPLLRMGLGVIADILVRGRRVIPARATALGYRFRFPTLDAALHNLVDSHPSDPEAVAQ